MVDRQVEKAISAENETEVDGIDDKPCVQVLQGGNACVEYLRWYFREHNDMFAAT